MAKILVLSADIWNMTDDSTGQALSGVSVWGVNQYRTDSADSRGLKPIKFSLDLSLWPKIKSMTLPAMCEAVYDVRPAAGGKAGLTVTDLKVVNSVDLFKHG